MFNKRKYINKKYIRLFYSLLVIIPALLLLIFTNSIYTNISTIKNNMNKNISSINDMKTLTTSSIINNYITKAEVQNKYTSEYILYGLATTNNNSLHDLIDNNNNFIDNHIYSQHKGYSVLFKSIQNDRVLFIADNDGIQYIDTMNAPLSEFKFNTVPVVLNKDAIDELSNKSIDYIRNKYSKNKTDINEEFIKKDLFTNINDLKDWNILIPTYISINNGNTYDFLIIREIPLNKIIQPYAYDINYYCNIINDYKDATNRLLVIIFIFASILNVLLIFAIICSIIKAVKEFKSCNTK